MGLLILWRDFDQEEGRKYSGQVADEEERGLGGAVEAAGGGGQAGAAGVQAVAGEEFDPAGMLPLTEFRGNRIGS